MPGGRGIDCQQLPQVLTEQAVGVLAPRFILLPQHPGRMHGGVTSGAIVQHVPAATVAHEVEAAAEQRGRCRGTQADDHRRFHPCDLALQPRPAGVYMTALRALVQAHLAAPLVVEMLHRVGQVQRAAFDAQFLQRAVQQLSGRAREGAATQVLDITGLFTHQHDACIATTFAEHGLGGRFPQRALPADGRLLAQRLQAAIVGSGIGCTVLPRWNTSLRRLRRPIVHLLHAVGRIAHKARQQLRFGKVLPVTGRHFLLHHPRVEPGRIEDAGVVGLPQGLACIFGGGILAGAAIAKP